MPITKNNTKKLINGLFRTGGKLDSGLTRAADEAAERYRAAVGFQGSDGNHSSPGEFPYRQTGQGQDHIVSSRSNALNHQVGTIGHDIPVADGGVWTQNILTWLAGETPSGNPPAYVGGRRKGLKDNFLEEACAIGEEFKNGANSVDL